MKRILALLLALALAPAAFGQISLVFTGAVWKYLANGSDQGTAWRSLAFDDTAWPSGAAQLGWGDGDENTVLFSGTGVSNAPVTTYFRNSFYVANKNFYSTLTLRVLRDDGVIVYLNGIEVARNNMPGGSVSYLTNALVDITTNESRYVQFGVSIGLLQSDFNQLAVELHQAAGAGRLDGSFDLELLGNIGYQPPQITLTRPADGSTFSNGPVLIESDASDPDGNITHVDYFVDGSFVGSATELPFSVSAAVTNGGHTIYGVAFDNLGTNTQSASVHVQVGSNLPVSLLRGPYLQSGSATGMVVRWRTDLLTNSVVHFGTNASGSLTSLVQNAAARTNEHQVLISGLRADTKYYFMVGAATQTFVGGDGSFRTSPTNARPVKVWVVGDSGTADNGARSVRDSYLSALGTTNTDLWLMLGDNAYGFGTDAEYQAAVFQMYPDILRRLVVWPTIGNHDAASTGAPGQFPYLDIFTLPANGEAGGLPSGSEKYYAFDYANIHFVCLDAESSSRATAGPMLTWLREDLAATEKDWIIAFWHQPPYSFGTHNSDSEGPLVEMRQNAVPILEAYGTDLVLCGHSHVYERSFLLNGHYGLSTTLTTNMILNGSLGNAAAPYRKPAGGLGAGRGTVYAVCGVSGTASNNFAFPRHPVMATNLYGLGSMILNISGLRLDAVFLRPDGSTNDVFSLDKSQPATVRPALNIAKAPGGAALTWPTSLPAYALETASIMATNAWHPATNTSTQVGRRRKVDLGPGGTNQFFRLRALP